LSSCGTFFDGDASTLVAGYEDCHEISCSFTGFVW